MEMQALMLGAWDAAFPSCSLGICLLVGTTLGGVVV